MPEKKDPPEFYGGFTGQGEPQQVPHSAGRAERLRAAGIPDAEPLDRAWERRAEVAFTQNNQEVGWKIEPPTEKSVVGYSAQKKAALKLMESEGLGIREALERVQAEEAETKSKKSTRGKGKGE